MKLPQRIVIHLLSLAMFLVATSSLIVLAIGTSMAQDIGINANLSGLLVTSFAVPYAITAPIIQIWFGSKFGAGNLLGSGLFILGAGSFITCMFSSWEVIIAARAVTALGAAIITPSAFVIATSYAKSGQQGRTTAALFLGFTLASIVAIPVGTQISIWWRWEVGFAIISALSIALGILSLLVMPSPKIEAISIKQIMTKAILNRPLLLLFCSIIFHLTSQFVLIASLSSFLVLYFQLPETDLPLVILAGGVLGVIGNQFAGSLCDRFGVWIPLRLSGLGFAIIALFLSTSLDAIYAAIAVIMFMFFANLFRPPQMTLMTQLVDPAVRGVAMGLNNSAAYIGLALGSALNAIVINELGYMMLGLTSFITLYLSVVFLEFVRRS